MPDLRKKKLKRNKVMKDAGEALWKTMSGPSDSMKGGEASLKKMADTAMGLMKDPSSHPRHVSQQSTVPTDAKPRIVVKPLKKYQKPE